MKILKRERDRGPIPMGPKNILKGGWRHYHLPDATQPFLF